MVAPDLDISIGADAEAAREARRFDQFKLIYDYSKFHIGLYLATPAAIGIVADAVDLRGSRCIRIALAVMIAIYGFSGICVGLFMGRHINTRWDAKLLDSFFKEAFSSGADFIPIGYIGWESQLGLED